MTHHLKSWKHVAELTREGASLTETVVYSYMLAKFVWFDSKGQEYFEGQESIAEAVGCSLRTVKAAIKALADSKRIELQKKGGSKHLRNRYFVPDKFKLYSHIKRVPEGSGSKVGTDWD